MDHTSPITSPPQVAYAPHPRALRPQRKLGTGLFVTALLLIQAATPGWAADRPIFTEVQVYRDHAKLTWTAVPGAMRYLIEQETEQETKVGPVTTVATVATVTASPGTPKSETWTRSYPTTTTKHSYRVTPLNRDGVRFPLASALATFDTARCPANIFWQGVGSRYSDKIGEISLFFNAVEKPAVLVVQRYRYGAPTRNGAPTYELLNFKLNAGAYTVIDKGIVPGVGYRYSARQQINDGIYIYSSTYAQSDGDYYVQALPEQPSALYFSTRNKSATLFWQPSRSYEYVVVEGRSYEIEKLSSVPGVWENVGKNITGTSYTINNLKTNAIHNFRVRTVFRKANSPWSDIAVTMRTHDGVTNLMSTGHGQNDNNTGTTSVRWTPPQNLGNVTVTGYLVRWMQLGQDGVYREQAQSEVLPNSRSASVGTVNRPQDSRKGVLFPGTSRAFVVAKLSDGGLSNREVIDTTFFFEYLGPYAN